MANLLSFSSVKLDLLSRDGGRLKPASGFVIEVDNQYYLITNWHVVSGAQQDLGMKPYLLKTSVHIHGGAGEKAAPLWMGIRKKITVQLHDDNDPPKWIEHQTHDERQHIVDIVALPIQEDLTLLLFSGKIPGIVMERGSSSKNTDFWTKVSAIPISAIDTDVEYGPPDTVHIIGYPFRWEPDGTDRTSSAFWRTCFIASEIYEPGMRRGGTFFVDPCPPEGMTGSPVLGIKNDRMKLLGVYSDLSTALPLCLLYCLPLRNAIAPGSITCETSSYMLSQCAHHCTMLYRVQNGIVHAHPARTSSHHAHSCAERLCACRPYLNGAAACPYRVRNALTRAQPART